VLPAGVSAALQNLGAAQATMMVELGSGQGKLAFQAFMEYPNLMKVIGCELSSLRFSRAVKVLSAWAGTQKGYRWEAVSDSIVRLVTTTVPHRVLEMRRQDMFFTPEVEQADIVFCEVAIPADRRPDLAKLCSSTKTGARLLLYHALDKLPGALRTPQSDIVSLVACTMVLDASVKATLASSNTLGSCSLRDDFTGAVVTLDTPEKILGRFQRVPNFLTVTSWAPSGMHFSTWKRMPNNTNTKPKF
jgi:hypothetical protein